MAAMIPENMAGAFHSDQKIAVILALPLHARRGEANEHRRTPCPPRAQKESSLSTLKNSRCSHLSPCARGGKKGPIIAGCYGWMIFTWLNIIKAQAEQLIEKYGG
ncbi:hypothetical protein [Dentiradicibacter hellwigii]|uniref:Uncharacterized protein n=1 Tax=Dentiradicibacter hellwigii TaxID=3149053 RepID=A0ABV4UHJ3_9RHOO